MGYERNDRRYGAAPDRDRFGYGRDQERGRASGYDYGSRDYRGDRFDDRGHDTRGHEDDRGFLDRAGDEVRSWFGDEDAERRRREDARHEEHYQRENRSSGYSAYGDPASNRFGAYGDTSPDRDRNREPRGGSRLSAGDQFGWNNYDANRDRSQQHHHDPSYRSWRDRQIGALDRDYDEYRRENQSRFDTEFHSWRQGRQGQRDQLTKVQEHQEVVGSDGTHVGKVDHVRDDHLLLAKQDSAAGGHHHRIPSSWIQSVDDKVTLNKTADQAKQQWRDEDRDAGSGGLFGSGDATRDANLNRSFKGTY